MTTPSSVVFLESDGAAIGRYPFMHGQRGTTFIQPHALIRDASSTTVDNIEHAKGEWKDVPMCVRDTILRLMRSSSSSTSTQAEDHFYPQQHQGSSRSGSLLSIPLSARGGATSSTPRTGQQPLSARGERPLSARGAASERPGSSQRRISFIASEGLPNRRRTPSSGPAAVSKSRTAPVTIYSSGNFDDHNNTIAVAGHVPHLSPMVERVLARSSSNTASPQRGAAATQQPTSSSPHHSQGAGAASAPPPQKSYNNSPFGGAHHHPYESPEKQSARTNVGGDDACHVPSQQQQRVVSPRRSPVNHPPQLIQGTWRPAGVVQPYESTEPFGSNASDGRSAKPKQQRALALSNLMTFHRGIERMKTDHETLLASQMITAMALAGPRKNTTATTSPRGHQGPTEGQKKAVDDVGYLLKALTEASVELVAQFASDEEKRYLGLHSHKYQTRAERQSSYQYTAPPSAVERKLKMPGNGGPQRLPPGPYSEHLATEEAAFHEAHSSPSFGPKANASTAGATLDSPHRPPQRLPSKALTSPVRSPRSATPSVPVKHSSSGSMRQPAANDFAVTSGEVDAQRDESDTALTSTNDQLKITLPPQKWNSQSPATALPSPPDPAPQASSNLTLSVPPPQQPETMDHPQQRNQPITGQRKDATDTSSSSSTSSIEQVVRPKRNATRQPSPNIRAEMPSTSAVISQPPPRSLSSSHRSPSIPEPVVSVAPATVPQESRLLQPTITAGPQLIPSAGPPAVPVSATNSAVAAGGVTPALPSNIRLVKRLVPTPNAMQHTISPPAPSTTAAAFVPRNTTTTPNTSSPAVAVPATTAMNSFLPTSTPPLAVFWQQALIEPLLCRVLGEAAAIDARSTSHILG
ncbi:GPI-anchored surface protein, putative [Bodo saltans]|uniref:GPI-anchored surface protein, putative n=1 Tax=Bodo saltans TaxID=75058 RepID=A0A0S4JII3_BODSA|nr:GPI-anchored surface protein, putative [Bodo saltans]|eukprot:CUG91326.1 GPI-anchored surface protein, putative [Bodo saltans]